MSGGRKRPVGGWLRDIELARESEERSERLPIPLDFVPAACEDYSPADWLRYPDAVRRISAALDVNSPIAEKRIAVALSGGSVSALAEHFSLRGADYFEVILPPMFWQLWLKHRDEWAYLLENAAGAQHGRLVGPDYAASGIRLSVSSLEAAFGISRLRPVAAGEESAAAKEPAVDAPRRGGGSSGKVAVWHDLWFAAMQMLDNGDLDKFATMTALRAELRRQVGDRLSDESLVPIARRIWYGFKERG